MSIYEGEANAWTVSDCLKLLWMLLLWLLPMASIWKHPKSRYFTACFRDETGKQRRISTKEIGRKLAQKIADTYESAARTKRTLRQTQAVIESLHEAVSGERISHTSLREYIVDWLEEKKPTTAPSTLDFYRGALRKFEEFMAARADAPITGITKADLVTYRNKMAIQISAKTANHRLKCIKMLFKSARRDGAIADDPTEFVTTLRQRGATNKRAFTLDEVKRIAAAADGEWQSMIYCGLYIGQRLADVATLRWSSINLDKGEIRLTTRKTDRAMVIPIAAPLKKFLSKVPESSRSGPIHPKSCAIVEREHRVGTLSNQFAEILAQAGLRKKSDHQKHKDGREGKRQEHELSFHSLRRTATTMLHEAGQPAAVAQALIGHDSEAIHQLYVSVGADALQRAAASLPDIG
jgi:integrase